MSFLPKSLQFNQKKDIYFFGASLLTVISAFLPGTLWIQLALFFIVSLTMMSSAFSQNTKRICILMGLVLLLSVYRFQYALCFFAILCLGFLPGVFVSSYPKMSKKWPHLKEKASVFQGLFSVFFLSNFISGGWSSPSSMALTQMQKQMKEIFLGKDAAFIQELMARLEFWYSFSWLFSSAICFVWACLIFWIVQCFASRSAYHLGGPSSFQTKASDYGLIVFAQVSWLFFSAESHMCFSIMIMSLLPFAAEGLLGFYRFFKEKSFKSKFIFVGGVLCISTVLPLLCLTLYRFFAPFLGVKKRKKSKGKA